MKNIDINKNLFTLIMKCDAKRNPSATPIADNAMTMSWEVVFPKNEHKIEENPNKYAAIKAKCKRINKKFPKIPAQRQLNASPTSFKVASARKFRFKSERISAVK